MGRAAPMAGVSAGGIGAMSIHQSGVTLKCDGCGLSKVFRSSEEAADWARRAGWREGREGRSREHTCTTCLAKESLRSKS